MADGNFKIVVDATDNGSTSKLTGLTQKLGAAVGGTNRTYREASKASKDFSYTQAQGVLGNASAGRSFSKLAESIGRDGNSGLVGAYATLAANAFAVVASFSALRGAAQVQQIFNGLEASGIRTGRALTVAAKGLRDVTGNAIDMEQSLRSTAQIVSGGFGADSVKKLGQAARDTSFALGRNVTDSLDRLSRGVVKLEPELLDELGLMTKLGESSSVYARQLNKTSEQLTNFEKRQGFMNAILIEADLKFGGLSASAGDTTAYDKLGATFTNLTNTVFNAINVVAKPLANLLSGSMTMLAGLGFLFASTLKNQLAPGLQAAAASAAASAIKFREDAKAKHEAVEATKQLIAKQNELALGNKKNFDNLGKKAPQKYLLARPGMLAGDPEATKDALDSLRNSKRINEAQAKTPKYLENPALLAIKQKKIDDTNKEIKATELLGITMQKAATIDVEASDSVKKARLEEKSTIILANREEAASTALSSASNFKFRESLASVKVATAAHREGLLLSASAAVTNAGAIGLLSTTMIRGQVALYGFALSARAVGIALLQMIPYGGTALIVIGLISTAIDYFKSEKVKKVEKAFEDLNETLANSNKYSAELLRISESQASASLRAAAALTLQSNAFNEAAAAYKEFVAATNSKGTEKSFIDTITNFFSGDTVGTVAKRYEAIGQKNILSYELGLKRGSQALNVAEILYNPNNDKNANFDGGKLTKIRAAAIAQYNALEQTAKGPLESVIKLRGGTEAFDKSLRKLTSDTEINNFFSTLTEEVGKLSGGMADAIKTFQEAEKAFNISIQDFSRSSASSTPFDKLVTSADAALNSIQDLKAAASAPQFTALLSGLGDSTKSTLSVDTAKKLKEYSEADLTVQTQLGLQKNKQAGFSQIELNAAQSILNTNIELGKQIVNDVQLFNQKVRSAQESARLAEGELKLLSAQMTTRGKIYAMGAAGRLTQINDEQKVRDVQKQQIQTQIDIQRLLSAQTESQIIKIKNEKISLSNLNEELRLIIMQGKVRAEQYASIAFASENPGKVLDVLKLYSGGLKDTSAFKDIGPSSKIAIDAFYTINDQLKLYEDNKTKIVALTKEENGLLQQNKNQQDSIKSLLTQIEALTTAELNKGEIKNQLQQAAREQNAESLKLIEAILDKSGDLLDVNLQIYGVINNVTNRLDFQLALITKSAQTQREASKRAVDAAALAYEVTKASAKVQTARAGVDKIALQAINNTVQAQSNNLELLQAQAKIDNELIDKKEQLAILEKVIFDTRSQGLEYQKTSLDFVNKQLEAERAIFEARSKGDDLRQELGDKQLGINAGKAGEDASKIDAAREALDFAIRESEVKKALIDLEYGLLAAQRDNLELELITRKTKLEELNVSDKYAGQFTTQIAQANSTLANLPNGQTILQAAALRKEAVDQETQNLRLQLQIAKTPDINNPLGASIGALIGLQRLSEARNNNKEAAPLAISSAAIDNSSKKTAAQVLVEVENVKRSTEVTANTDALKALTAAITKQVEVSPLNNVSAVPILGRGNIKGARSITPLIERDLGINVTSDLRRPGQAGKLGSNSPHVSDRALDIQPSKTVSPQQIQEYLLSIGAQGLKFVDETIPSVMKRTGATGPHWHFDWDRIGQTVQKVVETKVAQSASTAVGSSTMISAANDNVVIPKIVISKSEGVNNRTDSRGISNATLSTGSSAYEQAAALDTKLPEIKDPSAGLEKIKNKINETTQAASIFDEQLRKLGPQGEAVVALKDGMGSVATNVVKAIDTFKASGSSFNDKFQAVAAVASAALSTISGVLSAGAAAKEAAIDREINAEQKRDGKSEGSVAKIAALEKKKEEIAKKAFNTNKKIMIAQAIIATAAGVAQSLSKGPAGIPFAVAIGVMGAAQIAIIAGTQYESSSASVNKPQIPSLTIGKVGNTVDLARQNNNPGGEVGYLRGTSGTGTNASNYRVIGSAYGGEMPRGYGNSSYIVGEKGPETIYPNTPISVRPTNDNAGGNPLNATININAIDSKGMADVLHDQRGNIIGMLREAANANGHKFLEDVNVNVYTRPNVSRL